MHDYVRGHEQPHSAITSSGRTPPSLLLLGSPGTGKTTMLRDICRTLSDEMHLRVVVCDTSGEIGGDGDVPHAAIGRLTRRVPVRDRRDQRHVLLECIQNHTPQILVVDEIGTYEEVCAVRTAAQRGVLVVATAHGRELSSLVDNPELRSLLGGTQTVTVGDEAARYGNGHKTRQERAGMPCFGTVVEVQGMGRWVVHRDVADSVDIILRSRCSSTARNRESKGRPPLKPHTETRTREGSVFTVHYSTREAQARPARQQAYY